MSETLTNLRGQLDQRREKLAEVFAQTRVGPDEAGREVYDLMKAQGLSGDQTARAEQIRKMNDELDDLQAQVKNYEALRAVDEKVKALGETAPHPGHAGPGAKETAVTAGKTLGQLFVESPAFRGYVRGGQAPGPLAHLDIPMRAVLFETGVGWAPESLRTGIVTYKPLRPAPQVIDHFVEYPTSMAVVKYMEETTHTDNTAEIAEGVVYGEAQFILTERSQTVRKIGTWLPVTDEQLEDETEARAFVDNRLTYQLARRIDGQSLVGTGVAPNVLGTENVTGIQVQALGADPIFDAAMKLFRKIRDDGFAEPSVFFVAPSKWETVALTRTSDGVYIMGNPASDIPLRLWGVPGVQTTAHTATKLIAGDYVVHHGFYIRRGVDIQVGYQTDDFIKGRLAIRADVRVTPVHFRPKAFGTVTGL